MLIPQKLKWQILEHIANLRHRLGYGPEMPAFESVKQHPYRTAYVDQVTSRRPRDQLYQFERQLADLAGVTTDNHVVYEIVFVDGSREYVMFHDATVTFGRSMSERPAR